MRAADPTTRRLLVCGVVGAGLFVAGFTIEGALRADYDPSRTFVSELAFGEGGWRQTANFLISGLLILAFGYGLSRAGAGRTPRWPAAAVGAVGLGLVLAGVFRDGAGHALGAALLFLGLPVTCLLFARSFSANGDRAWAAFSVACGFAMLLLFAAALVDTRPMGLPDIAGLLQRASIVVGLGWLAAIAVKVMGETARRSEP